MLAHAVACSRQSLGQNNRKATRPDNLSRWGAGGGMASPSLPLTAAGDRRWQSGAGNRDRLPLVEASPTLPHRPRLVPSHSTPPASGLPDVMRRQGSPPARGCGGCRRRNAHRTTLGSKTTADHGACIVQSKYARNFTYLGAVCHRVLLLMGLTGWRRVGFALDVCVGKVRSR
jgi:hypothetical protein